MGQASGYGRPMMAGESSSVTCKKAKLGGNSRNGPPIPKSEVRVTRLRNKGNNVEVMDTR